MKFRSNKQLDVEQTFLHEKLNEFNQSQAIGGCLAKSSQGEQSASFTTTTTTTTANNNNNNNVSKMKNLNLNSVCGLSNLGNTCFFNSVLQNLAQTPFLEQLLDDNVHLAESNQTLSIKHNDDYDSELTDFEENVHHVNGSINANDHNNNSSGKKKADADAEKDKEKQRSHRSIPVRDVELLITEPMGILTIQLFELIKNMKSCHSVLTPNLLFSAVCKKVPSFKGFQQQDSHELLRNLLDAVKSEELKRRQVAILELFKVNKSSELDELTKKKIKRYGRLSSYTIVDKIFGGHLLSSIVCQQCKYCLQRVEPFLDLSLPIIEEGKGRADLVNTLANEGLNRLKKSAKQKPTKAAAAAASASANEPSIDNINSFLKGADEDNKKLSKHQIKKLKKTNKKQKKKAKWQLEAEKEEQEKANQADKGVENEENKANKNTDSETEEGETAKASIQETPNTDETHEKPESKQTQNDDQHYSGDEENESNDEDEDEDHDNADDDDDSTSEHSHFDFNLKNLENQFKLEATKSVGNRNVEVEPCTLESCLTRFTSEELLGDKINCENCSKNASKNGQSKLTSASASAKSLIKNFKLLNLKNLNSSQSGKVYTHATKQYLICELPAILTIHLKRFQQQGYRLEKSNKFISFPLLLDISNYTSKMCTNLSQPITGESSKKSNKKILYSLYGLVEHSGRLNSGHYTAYVKAGLRKLPDEDERKSFLGNHRICHLKKSFKIWSAQNGLANGELTNGVHATHNHLAANNPEESKWYYISDSHVSEIDVGRVLKSQAYMLFYERIQ